MSEVEETVKKKRSLSIWLKTIPIVVGILGLGFGIIQTWGNAKSNNTKEITELCGRVKVLEKSDDEKSRRMNEFEIEVDDFKVTMIEYAQKQDKAIETQSVILKEVKETNKIQNKVLENHSKTLHLTEQYIDFLIERDKAQVNINNLNKTLNYGNN